MSIIVPQLSTLIEQQSDEIAAWFNAAYNEKKPLFYSSVDLRHSGRKLAPVDTNIFPAGFNNLNVASVERGARVASRFFDAHFPDAKNILIIPENHTRNLHYLDNVVALKTLLEQSGKTVVIGSIDTTVTKEFELESYSGHLLKLFPLEKKVGVLQTTAGFIPDVIVINNDLTSGVPALLTNISQPIIPPTECGWHVRRKSTHFASYDKVVRAFSERFNIDPFLISTLFRQCGKVNFKERTGIECVALGVENVLRMLRQKYAEYGIEDTPYVFIKADNGTYGMGIMTVRSGEEVYEMNKKLRNKMGVIKEGVSNTEVIIQEGIPTIDKVEGHVAEPMIYLIAGEPVGCIYRVNTQHGAFDNLNAHGMHFEKNICQAITNHLTPFGLIARLASLAAAQE